MIAFRANDGELKKQLKRIEALVDFPGHQRKPRARGGSSIDVVEGVGHVCTVEAPAAFTAIALEFVRRNQAPE